MTRRGTGADLRAGARGGEAVAAGTWIGTKPFHTRFGRGLPDGSGQHLDLLDRGAESERRVAIARAQKPLIEFRTERRPARGRRHHRLVKDLTNDAGNAGGVPIRYSDKQLV